MHKKGISEETTKKRSRRTVKTQRAIVGATLDVIKAKRNQLAEVRQKAREEAIKAAKEKRLEQQKKKAAEKQKAAAPSTTQGRKQIVSKQQQKGATSKVQAKSR